MSYAAVIFDLDGTLLNTIEDLVDSFNAVLAAAGYPTHSLEAYKSFVGEGEQSLVLKAFPSTAVQGDGLERTMRAVREEYARRASKKTRPYPGIADLLDGVSSRGLPMGIHSNKPEHLLRSNVETFLPRWRFEAVRGGLPDQRLKPAPDGALWVANQLGVEPEQCAFVGDSGLDMETARAAGMVPLGVLWGFRDAEELAAAGARELIRTPVELLDVLFDSGKRG